RTIDTVLFDKTGTLTEGNHVVTSIATASPDISETDLLRLAAAAEANSEHPLARAIVSAAGERGIERVKAEEFEAIAGRGVAAVVEGARIAVGGPAMLREQNLTV